MCIRDRPEEAYAALVKDLARMQVEKSTGIAGTRINYTVPGSISLFKGGARAAKDLVPPYNCLLYTSRCV